MELLDIPYINHRNILVKKEFQLTIAEKIGLTSGVVTLPTGSGKTLILLILIAKHLQNGSKRFLVLAPKIILTSQHYQFLSTFLKYPVHLLNSEEPYSKQGYAKKLELVVVSTPHTMSYEIEKLGPTFFDAIFIDEVHHVSSGYPYAFLAKLDVTKVGFSAYVKDLSKVCKYLNIERNSISEAVTPPEISEQIIRIPSSNLVKSIISELTGIRQKRVGIFIKWYPACRNSRDPVSYFLANKTKLISLNFVLKQLLAKELKLLHILKLVGSQPNHSLKEYVAKKTVSDFFSITESLKGNEILTKINSLTEQDLKLEFLLNILATENYRKCIIFSKFRQTAVYLHLKVSEKYDCALLMGQGTDRLTNRRYSRKTQVDTLDEFKHNLKILIATSVAEEGLDICNTDLLICYQPPTTVLKYIQRRGRVGRNGETGKIIFLIAEGTYDEKALLQLRLNK